MTRRRLPLLAATLIASLLASAPLSAGAAGTAKRVAATARAKSAAVLPPANPAKPALWKIVDKDTTIWLFGTIHALPQGLRWSDGPVGKALDGADALVTEIPDTPPEALQGIVIRSAMLPADQNLRKMLPKADAALMAKTLGSYGLPAEALDRFEPWFAAISIANLALVKNGFSPTNGVEAQLGARIRAAGKPQEGLETVEYQLGLFDGLPVPVQIKYLREVLVSLPRFDSDLGKLVRYWSVGNPVELARLLNADEDDPRMIKVLLTDRNRKWADWIGKRMQKPGTVFIAVGAGHLAGPQSVQSRLNAAGLRVVRVQ